MRAVVAAGRAAASDWNRTPEKTKAAAAAGATVADAPAELASRVEVIITILTNAAAIDAVYYGDHGLLAGEVKGKLFIVRQSASRAVNVDRRSARLAREAFEFGCQPSSWDRFVR
jgi:3-hydroxyisobutyrate dehydrogenase-like beta-hydroxyacid dehydrogenase